MGSYKTIDIGVLKMKIVKANDEGILFDNGTMITYDYGQDCCERNYASFEDLEEIALSVDFNEKLIFEKADDGFRFGADNTQMFFIPCYSEQNGYYSSNVYIFFDGKLVLSDVMGEVIEG